MCNVPDCILFACFNIGKNDIRITITTYFLQFPKVAVFVLVFYSVFIII